MTNRGVIGLRNNQVGHSPTQEFQPHVGVAKGIGRTNGKTDLGGERQGWRVNPAEKHSSVHWPKRWKTRMR